MNKRALTLLEMVVSFGLLAVLLLSFSVIFTSLLKTSVSNSDRLEGLSVAQSVFESVRAGQEYLPSTGNQTILLYNGDARTPVEYIYNVNSTVVSSAGRLYQVDVDCWWNKGDPASGSRVHLHMQRLMTP